MRVAAAATHHLSVQSGDLRGDAANGQNAPLPAVRETAIEPRGVTQTDSPKPGKLPSGVLKLKGNERIDRDDWPSDDSLIPLTVVNPTSLQVVRDEADAQPRRQQKIWDG